MWSVAAFTLSVLGLLNLLILLGLARRVDALAMRCDRTAGAVGHTADPDPPALPAVGTKVGPFATVTTDGLPVGTGDLSGRTLVGFFAEACPTCHDLAPRFARHASVFPGGRDHVLAVVVAGRGTASGMAGRLAPYARVVVEPGDGPVARAFRVAGFPGACLLQDAVVVAAEGKLERLRLPD